MRQRFFEIIDGQRVFFAVDEKGERHYLPGAPAVPRVSKQKLPRLLTQGKNFLRAAGEHVIAGWKTADKALSEKRWTLCQQCDKLIDNERCALCGCWMEHKSKWAEQTCPVGKW